MPAPTSAKHVVNDAEWQSCEALGYVYDSPMAPVRLVEFINTNFPGLQLLDYLTEIDDLLKPMSAKKLSKVIGFDEKQPPELVVQYYSDDHSDKQNGLALSRTFVKEKNEKIAIHDFFRIPKPFRKLGHGKTMLKIGLQQYLNIGVDVIKVHAALEDGGFVWAKAHFTGVKKSEMSLILATAKISLQPDEFKKVKDVFDNYYTGEPNGKAFPINKWSNMPEMEKILRGSSWHGEINLNNQELLANFSDYVTEQKQI
jgi:hypothetical protein